MTAPEPSEAEARVLLGGGLQNERTTMAWIRTALSLLGTGALAARQTGSGLAAAIVLGIAAVAAGGLIADAERRHEGRRAAILAGDPVVALHHVAALAALVAALGLLSVLVVLIP